MFLCNWPTSKRGLLEAVGIALLHHHLSLYAAMVDAFTRLSTSNFVALFLESILYGIYIITCWTCAVALTRVNGRWKTMREIQWPFLLTGILLLLNTTSNLCLQFYRCLELLVYRGPVYSGWMTTVKCAQYLFQSSVGDLIIIYRIFVVYRRNWGITAPFIVLWLGDTGCACRALQLQISGASYPQFNVWFMAFAVLSVVHHIMITLLLLYRLWRIDRSLLEVSPVAEEDTPLRRIMRSIAESGMLYTVAAFVVVICQATKSSFANIVISPMVMVIVGIAFNLILIRAKQHINTQQDQQPSYPQFTTIGLEMTSNALSSSMIESKP